MNNFNINLLYGINKIGHYFYNNNVRVFTLYDSKGKLIDWNYEINK
jgi:hypothetical protein